MASSSYYAAKRRQVEPSARAARDSVMMQVLMMLWVTNRKATGLTSCGVQRRSCAPTLCVALEMARRSRRGRRLAGLVTHSDAGSQGSSRRCGSTDPTRHGHHDDVPPAELEAAFYAAQQADPIGVGIQ